MRKSERLRLMEMELIRLQFQVEWLSSALEMILETDRFRTPDLDSGKWYQRKTEGNH